MAADPGMMTILGFLDLNTPFDCVDHMILLQRLSARSASILSHYNGSRRTSEVARVEFATTASSPICASGISLGPKFFLLVHLGCFRSRRATWVLHTWICWRPPDLPALFSSRHNPPGFATNKCVENIESWMSSNRLRLNITKTEILWLGLPTRLASNPPSSIQITGSSIAPSKTVRSLGVLIDSAISFVSRSLAHQHMLLPPSSTAIHPPVALVRFESCSGTCTNLVQTWLLQRTSWRCSGRTAWPDEWCYEDICSLHTSKIEEQPYHHRNENSFALAWYQGRIDYNCVLPSSGCLNGLAPRYLARHCTEVSSVAGRDNCAQRHQECWWYQHAAPRQSVYGRLRCLVPALGTIFQWNLSCLNSSLAKLQERTENSFIHPNACETTVIWIYMCACIHILYIYIYVCACIHILYIYIYVCMYNILYIYIYVCMYTYTVYLYICVHVYIYCISIYMCACIHILYIYIYVCMYTYTVYLYICVHVYIYCISIYMCACIHILFIYIYVCICIYYIHHTPMIFHFIIHVLFGLIIFHRRCWCDYRRALEHF